MAARNKKRKGVKAVDIYLGAFYRNVFSIRCFSV
jgi:hypothetical protein